MSMTMSDPVMDPMTSFWSSLFVYIERPNLINKRLMGCCALNCWQISDPFETICDLMQNCSLDELKGKLPESKQLSDFQLSGIRCLEGQTLIVRHLLPKLSLKNLNTDCDTNTSQVIDFVLIDIPNARVVFVPKATDSHVIPECSHELFLNDTQEIELKYLLANETNVWLDEKVVPKLRQWMRQELEGKEMKGSLKLIGVDHYCLTYNRLKRKYGQQLVQMWRKYETTDPLKFVFEDIAIASYLIVLWEQQNEARDKDKTRKQSFVDIGCGNGLLVYLLTNEGYKGLGIDLRRRNIWDKYEPKVDLVEKVFTPSDESLGDLFGDYEWLIGNHSDELTPWIPYMAANSSHSTNAFLLPCCPFDFNGSKYQRTASNLSQYSCYIQYLQTVCQQLGFEPKVDKLRIPSTKRICIICDQRNYDKSLENEMRVKRKTLINEKLKDFNDYKPRDKVETVRNCSRLPKDVIEAIVTIIANELLDGNENLTIGSIPKLLTTDMLTHMKSQCGGIQTLLRNNKHIFEVSGGIIGFTRPKPIDVTTNGTTDTDKHLKSKRCWFFHSHPNGCPLPATQCRYIH
ncbi:unnamed protein product [Oppiella nova]|uniref:tRNA (uracil-O(2)-)-methyltransferase n=1 Tax=Oppiella nova TaxID=334625 RepID=A0A7R9LEZ5_9ACAR|nr:unnamed protein product [Oppiella nova]CAG2162991.1 unnamed protein product [Oppiella nova]